MAYPQMFPVVSSNIHDIGYDESEKRLYVRFKSDPAKYHSYADVPQNHYDEMLNHKSPGSFFSRAIRNDFAHKRHDD